ncbi:energy transducer TonB [Marivita sp. S6314]|uniref:TonB family protein n=1 Tax=Marivita sp. S6314 TaxID=2926406 RepID=UPI001FF5FC8D|nr:TonB family protein [Marivita sp. S6314]MCK0149079.1 energy transducer TonB [Marivita sp. S6314]
MRVVEVALFLTLSGALHVAALTLAPPQTGGSGGGEGGTADLSLTAASPTLAAMVDAWDRPPETSTAPVMQPPQPAPEAPRPTAERAVLTPPAPETLAHAALAPMPPDLDTRLPAPPVPLAQTDLGQFEAPALPLPAALPRTTQTERPMRHRPDAAVPNAASDALPTVDTAPPRGAYAPTASLRPEARTVRRAAPAKAKPAPSAARPAQTARGSGQSSSSAVAPKTKAPAAAGPSKAQLAQAQASWGAKIRSSVARAQRYPNGTRARGTVKLQISVSPAGRVVGVSVVQSSGDRRLDKAALAAVKRARLPRAPKGLTAASYRFNLPLSFKR